MCSIEESLDSLKENTTKLNINEHVDDKDGVDSGRRKLVLSDKQLESLTDFDKLLCDKFGVSKSKIREHRKEIIEAAASLVQPSKVADAIYIDRVNHVNIGPKITINEQIILNSNQNEFEMEERKMKDYKNYFQMIDRMHWLAQPPVSEISRLKKPASYVIICHTASQEAFTQAENVLMLRLIQTFHIESQGWADVAYNFCIGSDGNVYEGRGWFVQGSHTLSYNAFSLGIAFIGCFLDHLPPATSLKKCKDLIAHGVKIGAISPDYELLGHRQCRPFQSPGDRLFNEIKTWDHFNPHIDSTTLCKIQEV